MGNRPSRSGAPSSRAHTGQQQPAAPGPDSPSPFSQAPPVSNGQYYGGATTQPQSYAHYPGPHQGVTYPPPPTHTASAAAHAPPRAAPATQEYQTTATIRNQVNLKKHTLTVAALPANPAILTLAFTFDTSAACRVTTFVCAREDVKASCKVEARGAPAAAVHYETGLEHRFPPPAEGGAAAAAAASGHSIDTSAYSTSELTDSTVGSETYPIIVRLEALTEEGRAEGRSLADLPPGGETPKWVQSQSTYARLVKEDDGTWGVRVVKQKIWVKGVAYELQEIYGMEQNRGAGGAGGAAGGGGAGGAGGGGPGEDVEGNECVICMSAARDTTALPCRHMCMCHACASALKTQTNKCPICRNEIESLLHITIQKCAPPPPAAPAAAAAKASAAAAADPLAAAGAAEPAAAAAAAAAPAASGHPLASLAGGPLGAGAAAPAELPMELPAEKGAGAGV